MKANASKKKKIAIFNNQPGVLQHYKEKIMVEVNCRRVDEKLLTFVSFNMAEGSHRFL